MKSVSKWRVLVLPTANELSVYYRPLIHMLGMIPLLVLLVCVGKSKNKAMES